MKKIVFLAGSRKFTEEIEKAAQMCREAGAVVLKGRDSLGDENAWKMLQRIDEAGIMYVIAKGGYIGDTVKIEINYAHSKGKEIIASEHVNGFPVSNFMNIYNFVEYLKK
jgi:hypothetical protein